MKTGDLVYLPAEVTLVKYDKTGKVVSNWVSLQEPAFVLVTLPIGVLGDPDSPFVGVHYQGSSWLTKVENCREVRAQEIVSQT